MDAVRKANTANMHLYCWDEKLLDPGFPSNGGDTGLPYWNVLLDRKDS